MTRKKNKNPIPVTMAKNTCLIPNNTQGATISPKIAKRLHNFFFIPYFLFVIYYFVRIITGYFSEEIFPPQENEDENNRD